MATNRFIIKKTKDGQFYWVLIATNGKIIARSFDLYRTKVAAENGIESTRRNSYDGSVEDQT